MPILHPAVPPALTGSGAQQLGASGTSSPSPSAASVTLPPLPGVRLAGTAGQGRMPILHPAVPLTFTGSGAQQLGVSGISSPSLSAASVTLPPPSRGWAGGNRSGDCDSTVRWILTDTVNYG